MRSLALSLLLAATTASMAAAAGLNLAWNNCFPSPGAALDQSFRCEDSAPGANDANDQVFRLVASVVPATNINGVIAWGATIDFQGSHPTVDDWWRLAGGECRDGAISFQFNAFTNTTTCAKNLMTASPPPLAIANWVYPADKPANWSKYAIGVVRTTGVTVVAGTQYQLCIISIDAHNTTLSADGSSVACSGCLDPACIVFNEVEIDVPVAQQPPDGKNLYYTADQRQHVTWQGGEIGVFPCPIGMPIRRATWGTVRSLYR